MDSIVKLEANIEAQTKVEDLINRFMKSGVDYFIQDEIQQGGVASNKKILKKAGAEWLASIFELKYKFELLPDVLNQHGVATVNVVVTLMNQEGAYLANSYGSAFLGFYNYDRNTGVKVAQNRALVGAIISHLGLSRLFHEDRSEESSETAASTESYDVLIGRVKTLAQEVGVAEKQLLARFNVAWEEMHQDQLQSLLKMLLNKKKEVEASKKKEMEASTKPLADPNNKKKAS